MRILILKGQSQYGGTRLFCDEAAAAFRRCGHQVEVLDLGQTTDGGPLVRRHAETAGRIDLIFTINIAGEFMDGQGRTLSDLYGAPHVIWHTDYVLSQAERVRRTPKSTALLLVDPTQVEAVLSIYGPDRFDHVAFFPHPGVGAGAPDDTDAAEFVARRSVEVLWAGGFQAPERLWDGIQTPAAAVMREAVELALSVEWRPPHEVLDEVLAARGLDLANPAFIPAREAAQLIDLEVRRTRRFEFLKAVAKSGVPVRICGAGWEKQLYRFKNAVFEGEVEMPRLTELMGQSRIVLNTNANFGAGSHERPFSTSLAGAAAFSDYSRYYAEVFEPGKDIELFFWMDLDGAMQRLTALVADPERCFANARRAKAKTVAQHTWDARIGLIFAAADAVRR